jgi:hypothetical protein
MQTHGAGLKTDFTPLGIVSLELASSIAQLEQILAIWNQQNVVLNIGLDFLFIPAYTFFFIQSLKNTISKHRLNWLQQLGTKLIAVAYVAAALDVIENVLMLSSMMGHYSAGSICATASIATTKFVGIGFILLYLLGSLPSTLSRKVAN